MKVSITFTPYVLILVFIYHHKQVKHSIEYFVKSSVLVQMVFTFLIAYHPLYAKTLFYYFCL